MQIRNRFLFNLGLCLLAFTVVGLVTGCAAPTFLTDLEQIIPIASAAVAGILSIIGSFAGQPELLAVSAAISAVAGKVEADLKTVDTLIASYKQNPNDTVLQNIESAINTAIGSLQAVLQVNGVPSAEAAKISALVNAITQQLEALLTVLPVFNSTTAGQQLSVRKPVSAVDFKAQIAAIVPPSATTTA